MEYTRIISTWCYLLFVVAISAETCDKSNCPGPTKYYEELNCIPVYRSPKDCCPYKYDCNHLHNRSPRKCYINGHQYKIGEQLRDEDKNPCDVGCFCSERGGIARFTCAVVDCYWPNMEPNCYRRKNATQCCPGEVVCPEKPEDRPTCEVDGKIYKDGEPFSPKSEPQKSCYCGPGYAGENVAPYCTTLKNSCGIELRHPSEIKNNCAPVYYSSQSPKTSCALSYRCQNERDRVIKKDPSSEPNPSTTCKFGNLTLNYGDELNQAADYGSVCVKCVCEVGPTLTCQRLPNDECDIADHPPFDRK